MRGLRDWDFRDPPSEGPLTCFNMAAREHDPLLCSQQLSLYTASLDTSCFTYLYYRASKNTDSSVFILKLRLY